MSASTDADAAHAKNDELLARLETRKEMRKTRGAVRMTPGEVERREVAFDNLYFGPDEEEESGDDDGDEEEDSLGELLAS